MEGIICSVVQLYHSDTGKQGQKEENYISDKIEIFRLRNRNISNRKSDKYFAAALMPFVFWKSRV
jgi:hypothetical protein